MAANVMVAVLLLFAVFNLVACHQNTTTPYWRTWECCPRVWGPLGAMFPLPRDCEDIRDTGGGVNGVYTVYPCSVNECKPTRVYCEQQQDGGGWTVFQRRIDGGINFVRDWQSYKEGFGITGAEHWLGLENLHNIIQQERYRLRVELMNWAGTHAYAFYDVVFVGSEATNYTLTVGRYHGDAGDGLSTHSGMQFSTFDRDNDRWTGNCARDYTGAWWYTSCHNSNLNGQYLRGRTTQYAKGIVWQQFMGYNYSLKEASMMIKKI
ncbi:fibrinogen C domain-containing protein 1-like [Antedon mediterranea]|uniref:fibrinogen C domain-containing protein 1-like n=1 Tax=Antedon mediterranea TaxID=105859 RepID=UPI003AF6DCB8